MEILGALAVLSLFVWWLLRPRTHRIKTKDLRGWLDHLLENCEPGSAILFSSNRKSRQVRVHFESLREGVANLLVTVYVPELDRGVTPELRREVDAACNQSPEMRRPACDRVSAVIEAALRVASDASEIFVRGAPIIYGRRTDTRIRDDYRSLPNDVPFLSRIGRHYERKTGGAKYEAASYFTVSAGFAHSKCPPFPHAQVADPRDRAFASSGGRYTCSHCGSPYDPAHYDSSASVWLCSRCKTELAQPGRAPAG